MRVDSTQRPNKKHRYSLKKHTFCPRARRSAAYRIIDNKIKKQLVSRKKLHRRTLRRSRSIVRHTAIALTFKIEAAGSWRAGGDHGVGVFWKLRGVLWLCVVGSI